MTDSELPAPSTELKRPRYEDQNLSEDIQEVSASALDDIATPAKKFRADDSVVAISGEGVQAHHEVATVEEGEREVDFRDSDDKGKKVSDASNDEGEDKTPNGEQTKSEAEGKLSNGQGEDIQLEGGGADGGCEPGENGQDVEKEDAIKQEAKGLKLVANDAPGLDEDRESNEREDSVKSHAKEVKLGPKVFTSSLAMFNYFYDLLRGWPINFNVNKYEHMMLEDLIKKGHQDPERKIGAGIEAFQIRINPEFYSRCYYVVQKDGSTEDFSYRKCVDSLMPLPDNMKSPSGDLYTDRKGQGGHQSNRGRGGRGRGNRGHGGRKRF